jgi:hypothetical protein
VTHIVIRNFQPVDDSGFIYSTWPKNVFYSGILNVNKHDKKRWFQEFYNYLQKLIPESEISIACMDDDKNTILGYSVVSGRTLQFIYVKELFRKQGIGSLLFNHNKQIREINQSFLTHIAESILQQHPNLIKKENREI